MKKIKITVMRKANYPDLIEKYEGINESGCPMEIGQTFIVENLKRPENFCESAWNSMREYISIYAYGGKDVYEGWMKDPNTIMLSCADGFRPVSFFLETIEE